MSEQVSPGDALDAQKTIELIDELLHWIVERAAVYSPQIIAMAVLFAGGKITELHIKDRKDFDGFVADCITAGQEAAILSLKMCSCEDQNKEVDGK